MKPLIYDLNLEELKEKLKEWGESAFRARQLWEGIYVHLWNDPQQFSNLSLNLRARLSQEFQWQSLEPQVVLESEDGETIKTLFSLADESHIEVVLMKYETRRTLCISTQVGCAMGCVFCATGQMGLTRNLSAGEIIEQVLYYARQLKETDEKITNVVVMGMGEPFHNYDETLKAIRVLNAADGFELGARRITVSTVGLAPKIHQFAGEGLQVNLAISLHAADDALRSSMLPVNQRYPLAEVIEACHAYVQQTGRRVTFEWALVQGVNDTQEQAHKLVRLLDGLLCHVNLIPLNPTRLYAGERSSEDRVLAFQRILQNNGIACTLRLRRGVEIQAGCGQLADRPTNE